MRKTIMILINVLVLCASLQAQEFPRVNAVVKAVRKSGPSVVNISAEQVRRTVDPFYQMFHKDFFQSPMEEFFSRPRTRTYKVQSLGSGVVIDGEGYIITNDHVIHGASKIVVTVSGDKKNYEGRVISSVPEKDLALIKIETDKPLQAIEMGDSDALMIGETAVALGNPFGLENTVTTGVISAKNRDVGAGDNVVFEGLLQTDAAINPGNSGGALLDINGRLIGINTAIKQGAEGIGFAIPVNEVKRILKDLLSVENVRGLWLGIKVEDAGSEGVLVTEVDKDSPAGRAEIVKGSTISEVNGAKVKNCLDFHKKVMSASEKDTTIRFKADKAVKSVTLEKYGESMIAARCGLRGRNLNRWIARRLRIAIVEDGILVTEVAPDSPAAAIGLETGDVVIKLGDERISRVDDMITVLRRSEAGKSIEIIVVRQNKLLRGEITLK